MVFQKGTGSCAQAKWGIPAASTWQSEILILTIHSYLTYEKTNEINVMIFLIKKCANRYSPWSSGRGTGSGTVCQQGYPQSWWIVAAL